MTLAASVNSSQNMFQLHQDVIEIDEQTWAIHGYIAYAGDVIAATFASANDAWAGLSRLQEIEGHHPT
jgi:hypothetical protein